MKHKKVANHCIQKALFTKSENKDRLLAWLKILETTTKMSHIFST